MTPSELKRLHEQHQPGSHFFDRKTMQFFGDTMKNYGVKNTPVGCKTRSGKYIMCWELYRRNPVKHGLQTSAFFHETTFESVHPL
jgi:hypothetical protein